MTLKTPLTIATDDDFFDDAVTAQYLIARLIDDAVLDFATNVLLGDEDSDDVPVVSPTPFTR